MHIFNFYFALPSKGEAIGLELWLLEAIYMYQHITFYFLCLRELLSFV